MPNVIFFKIPFISMNYEITCLNIYVVENANFEADTSGF